MMFGPSKEQNRTEVCDTGISYRGRNPDMKMANHETLSLFRAARFSTQLMCNPWSAGFPNMARWQISRENGWRY